MNEQTSNKRFDKWLSTSNISNSDEQHAAQYAWDAQEAYWSKRCEEMETQIKYLQERIEVCHKSAKRDRWYLSKYSEAIEEMQKIGSVTFGEIDLILSEQKMKAARVFRTQRKRKYS